MSEANAVVPAGPRLLTALAGAQLLVALDFSVIYVALPDIGAALSFRPTNLQWVVSAYAILFAEVLLIGGQLVDAVGGGRVFGGSLAGFAIASAVAGAAPTAGVLIVARGAQGACAGLLVPATLGLLNLAYPVGPRRNHALTVWGTTGALGLVLGVTAGGGLLTVASWRWVFWVSLPVVVMCLAAGGPAIRARIVGTRRAVAVVSAGAASASVIALVLVFTELARPAPQRWTIVVGLLVTVAGAATFVSRERRGRVVLVPRSLLTVGSLRVACLAAALYLATFGAEFFLVTLYLQQQRGYSALVAGLAFLPLAAAVVVGNTFAGVLAARLTHRRLLAVSYGLGAIGLAVLAGGVTEQARYWPVLLLGMLVSGAGQGIAFTATFIVGTRELPPDAEGTGSALITTAQYIGGSLGLAVLVLVLGRHPTASDFGLALLLTAVGAILVAPMALRALREAPEMRRQPAVLPQPDV